MTAVTRVTGSKLLVQIGDGGSPTEVFAHDCLINTARGIKFSSETTEDVMPDCDNPNDPAWKSVSKDGLQATITGSGKLYTSSVEAWWTWFKGDIGKNCRVKIDVLAAAGGGHWAGSFKLTEFEISAGGNKENCEAQVTLVSDGALVWVDAT